MKSEWQKLTSQQQKVYRDKAEYLLEKNYVQDKSINELAKQIYEKEWSTT